MTRKTRRLIMSAWLIFAAVLLTALVSGIIINTAGVAVLNDYWRAG